MGTIMQLSDRIERRMELQDLRVLMTVVQAGSMGKAAERLNTSQPNVSRSIAELEQTLGVRLLDRHRQGVAPTEYGRALLDCGVGIFDGLWQGLKKLEFLADPTAGEVRVGTIIPLAASFVSPVVDRLSGRCPRIVFHIAATEADTLHRQLVERNLDLVIIKRIGPFTDEQFSVETLFHDSYVVVAGAQHPWARRRKIELAELNSQSWVLPPPETAPGAVLADAFRAGGLEYPRVTVFTIPSEVRTSLLASGRFLTIFPTSALRAFAERAALKVLPVKLPIAPVPVGIVTLKNRALSPVAQLFIDTAHEVAKSQPIQKG
jgi:DNA-binding transcriptional LysR family regulator